MEFVFRNESEEKDVRHQFRTAGKLKFVAFRDVRAGFRVKLSDASVSHKNLVEWHFGYPDEDAGIRESFLGAGFVTGRNALQQEQVANRFYFDSDTCRSEEFIGRDRSDDVDENERFLSSLKVTFEEWLQRQD